MTHSRTLYIYTVYCTLYTVQPYLHVGGEGCFRALYYVSFQPKVVPKLDQRLPEVRDFHVAQPLHDAPRAIVRAQLERRRSFDVDEGLHEEGAAEVLHPAAEGEVQVRVAALEEGRVGLDAVGGSL